MRHIVKCMRSRNEIIDRRHVFAFLVYYNVLELPQGVGLYQSIVTLIQPRLRLTYVPTYSQKSSIVNVLHNLSTGKENKWQASFLGYLHLEHHPLS